MFWKTGGIQNQMYYQPRTTAALKIENTWQINTQKSIISYNIDNMREITCT